VSPVGDGVVVVCVCVDGRDLGPLDVPERTPPEDIA
jgi:hypothetical protein